MTFYYKLFADDILSKAWNDNTIFSENNDYENIKKDINSSSDFLDMIDEKMINILKDILCGKLECDRAIIHILGFICYTKTFLNKQEWNKYGVRYIKVFTHWMLFTSFGKRSIYYVKDEKFLNNNNKLIKYLCTKYVQQLKMKNIKYKYVNQQRHDIINSIQHYMNNNISDSENYLNISILLTDFVMVQDGYFLNLCCYFISNINEYSKEEN